MVGFQLLHNYEVGLHEQEEIEGMAKKRLIPQRIVEYNRKVDGGGCSWVSGWRESERGGKGE